MYAVVETGGKQYRVASGDVLTVERLEPAQGQRIEFDRVLMVVREEGEASPLIGTPLLPGAKVVGEVVDHGRDKKVLVFKKKRRKNYRRIFGHRQGFTRVKITEISVNHDGA